MNKKVEKLKSKGTCFNKYHIMYMYIFSQYPSYQPDAIILTKGRQTDSSHRGLGPSSEGIRTEVLGMEMRKCVHIVVQLF